ncbi:C-C motif chemokine 3-like [Poeciliopsis prolifica]|uniref:C-C motif chemokine 3-like n=1 Tax=Poeciliopsis prolifica TaxID=188132 RepID=UPI0024142175|nr:C-C motif chemokine 3-like [Poeciliopsis prolifica]
MKAVHILLLCMLGAALLATVLCNNGNGPDNCCFDFFKNPMDKKRMSSYYRTDPRCTVAGVILMTLKGREICVDPNESWVKKVMNFVDRKTI